MYRATSATGREVGVGVRTTLGQAKRHLNDRID